MKTKKNPIIPIQKEHRKQLIEVCTKTLPDIENLVGSVFGVERVGFLENRIRSYGNKVVDKVRELLIKSIHDAITITILHYADLYKRKHNPIHKGIQSKTRMSVLRHFKNNPFYGNTFDGRISRLNRIVDRNIRGIIQSANIYDNKEELIDDLYEVFYGEPPIDHKTLRGQADTLLVSEQNRLYYYTAQVLFKTTGINYARFCLIPQHTQDSCDELASNINPVIKSKLEEEGIEPEGVYYIDDLPEYPHPRAIMYLEPIFELVQNPIFNSGI